MILWQFISLSISSIILVFLCYIFPYNATIVLWTCYDILAVVAYITTEDLIFMSFKKAYIFTCLRIPNSTNTIKPCAKNEIILSIKLYSSHLSLMTFESEIASWCVNIIYSNCWISWCSCQFFSSQTKVKIKYVSLCLLEDVHRFSWANIPNDAGSIARSSGTNLSSILNSTTVDLTIMPLESWYFFSCF